jgi:hypothetical protein
MDQVVEGLPNMCKALSSNTSTAKKKKKKKNSNSGLSDFKAKVPLVQC